VIDRTQKENKYPKIYLAIDNCFAFKRWTRPKDWAKVIKDLGVNFVEASADTELDPLFMGEEYLKGWVEDVKDAEAKYGIKVANLYSGHGTYCTLGLTHTDEMVRRRMIDKWFKPLIKTAGQLDAGIGFFAHAFADYILQDKSAYDEYIEILYTGLTELNAYADEENCGDLGLEQMYSPHQVPWRIEGTRKLIKEITRRSGRDFFFTEDVGHHHIKFVKPTEEDVLKAVGTGNGENLWLGTNKAYKMLNDAVQSKNVSNGVIKSIMNEFEDNPQMFARKEDGDCYEWLKRLGCYSPIIHLQQTDGLSSSHAHFTEENNSKGIISGECLLRAIKESYENNIEDGMPGRCGRIYLTLEVFTSTASINIETLKDYALSVEYWRKFVPEDGMRLDELV